MRPIDKCAICGETKELTKEHTPPRSAFNKNTILLSHIDKTNTTAELKWETIKKQGGNFEYILCEDCNSAKTGHWYGSAYVEFVKQCAPHAKPQNGGTRGNVCMEIYPNRVIKQALSILCASCGTGLTEKHPILRKIILNKNYRGIPGLLRIWLYLRAHEGGRSTGEARVLNMDAGKNQIIAEFSWWPVGWILSFNDQIIPNLTEITYWCNFGADEKKNISIDLSCHWAATAWPLDFRSPDKVLEEANRQQGAKESATR